MLRMGQVSQCPSIVRSANAVPSGGVKQLRARLLDWKAYLALAMSSALPPAPSNFGAAASRKVQVRAGAEASPIQARDSPQLTSNFDRVDAGLFPPSPLIPDAMNRPVMDPAQRGNEFITHLPAECTRLHEAQVMGI